MFRDGNSIVDDDTGGNGGGQDCEDVDAGLKSSDDLGVVELIHFLTISSMI